MKIASRALLAIALVVGSFAPLRAQSLLDRVVSSGAVFEAGAFAYGRDRYPDDTEVRLALAAGWRGQYSGWFAEPHLRFMAGLDGWGGSGRCDLDCAGGAGTAMQELPMWWPGLIVGRAFGDESFAHGLALRGALGLGDERVQPLVALRYEASSRRVAWYVEASMDRAPWATVDFDGTDFVTREGDDEWLRGISAGGRYWLRPVRTPRPAPRDDAGIIPPQPELRKD